MEFEKRLGQEKKFAQIKVVLPVCATVVGTALSRTLCGGCTLVWYVVDVESGLVWSAAGAEWAESDQAQCHGPNVRPAMMMRSLFNTLNLFHVLTLVR